MFVRVFVGSCVGWCVVSGQGYYIISFVFTFVRVGAMANLSSVGDRYRVDVFVGAIRV